jgi:PAS domain S-box-containing protein
MAVMSEPIRIVHLEDDPEDAEQVRNTLARDNLTCTVRLARSREEFEDAIESDCDLVLANYGTPGFDGAAALRVFRAKKPDVPFILVSAMIGEETAVECIKDGATDCVLKDHLDRLPNAVRRALREAGERRDRQRAEGEVRHLNEELERRVDQRTAQLAAANIGLQRRRAELDEAKVFLEHLLSASPSMVFRFAPDTRLMTYVSPNIGWLLGYSPDEVVGVEGFWEQLVHPADRARMVVAVRDAMAAMVAQTEQECRCRGKDGRYRWFLTLLRIEYDAESRPVAILGYALDIGDRKAAEEEVRQERIFCDSIIENLPAVVFVKQAPDLRYARFNRAAEETLGLTRDEVIGRTDFEVFPPTLARWYREKDEQVLRSGRPVEIPEEVIAPPGHEPRIVQTKKIPILDRSGEPLYVVGVSIDITAQRKAHEEVRLSRLEAERASRSKSEFLSRMSHELRTPLNAILGFAQILQMDELSLEQAEGVEQILQGGVHLLELINEVLDISRIEAGQLSLSPEPVPVVDVITQVVSLVRPLGVLRQVSISAESAASCPFHVRADRQRLKQILVNLVSNAVKYNKDMGLVRLACEQRGDAVRILVSDTGAGILPEKRALLFQPFERLGADQGPIEGTGLGLAVSKGLVEAMGGRIGVDSEIDAGSTFWIELPEAAAPEPRDAAGGGAGSSAPLSAGSGHVLYVEDNRSNVRLLERLLARRPGVRLDTASTGQTALEFVQHARPDLILLDLHLPDMSGEEVLRRIWSDRATRSIPIAVLSADASPRQQQRLLAAGAIAYLTKPLDVAALLRLIDERLSVRIGGR